MYEVHYGTNKNKTVLATFETYDEAKEFVTQSINNHFPKSYYIRMWENNNGDVVYDFGSHTYFYFIKEVAEWTEI